MSRTPTLPLIRSTRLELRRYWAQRLISTAFYSFLIMFIRFSRWSAKVKPSGLSHSLSCQTESFYGMDLASPTWLASCHKACASLRPRHQWQVKKHNNNLFPRVITIDIISTQVTCSARAFISPIWFQSRPTIALHPLPILLASCFFVTSLWENGKMISIRLKWCFFICNFLYS